MLEVDELGQGDITPVKEVDGLDDPGVPGEVDPYSVVTDPYQGLRPDLEGSPQDVRSADTDEAQPANVHIEEIGVLAEATDPATIEQQEAELTERLNEAITGYYEFLQEWVDKVPEAVPVVRPYFNSIIKMGFAPTRITLGEGSFTDRLKEFAQLEMEAMLSQVEAALDVLSVMSLGGVSLKGVDVDKIKLALELLTSEKAEDTVIDGVPAALDVLGGKAENEQLQQLISGISRAWSALSGNDFSRGSMEDFLKNQDWWKELKVQLADLVSKQDKVEQLVEGSNTLQELLNESAEI